ncbi:VanZ family protein [Ruminiclostridium sufflavum DSM 19573]|uniref:VanZ family protein n=1 Tax=Ruminiclostridium sufflavum DSM 19573 TaxID=1121337 RepID=A0A318XN74_9FIRM|nr:VanZ family protein [Ruminiclostridium sufflavum]PYG89467.1 VanZ family protein [Ruminiclostridium sufflavum DSM 19573]
MKKRKISIVVIALAGIWLGVIFFMSSQTAADSTQMSKTITRTFLAVGEKAGIVEEGASTSNELISKYDPDTRKMAHVIMYFLLASVIFAALWELGANKNISAVISFFASICIAVIDEINQMSFTGRNSGVVSEGIADIYRDASGIGIALVILLVLRAVKEIKNRKV